MEVLEQALARLLEDVPPALAAKAKAKIKFSASLRERSDARNAGD
ncbi:MAG TPA: hypothetical protein VNE62_01725 [Actinomycetota bacterium]|nr:hypothetical protein [Actinomycetota bacterium]